MATRFSELGIKTESKEFKGNKIEIYEVFGREITIHHFRIVDSKFEKKPGSGKRLDMQITINGEYRMLWTSSANLIKTIEQIPIDRFPITTTIIKTENKRFDFT